MGHYGVLEMIAFLLAATLHVTSAERFFCDDRYRETLAQCVHRTRAFYCHEHPDLRWPSDDRIARLYAQTIREEQRGACHRHGRR